MFIIGIYRGRGGFSLRMLERFYRIWICFRRFGERFNEIGFVWMLLGSRGVGVIL